MPVTVVKTWGEFNPKCSRCIKYDLACYPHSGTSMKFSEACYICSTKRVKCDDHGVPTDPPEDWMSAYAPAKKSKSKRKRMSNPEPALKRRNMTIEDSASVGTAATVRTRMLSHVPNMELLNKAVIALTIAAADACREEAVDKEKLLIIIDACLKIQFEVTADKVGELLEVCAKVGRVEEIAVYDAIARVHKALLMKMHL